MKLEPLNIPHFQLDIGKTVSVETTYQRFGQPLGEAPIVLVNHALTGNSQVTGENGWWNSLIGNGCVINTSEFTVLAMDIVGNGFSGNPNNLIENYRDWTLRDVAKVQVELLHRLEIDSLFAVIGGSLGGQLAWEFAVLDAVDIKHLIPIASDWKATDWLLANCRIQDSILNNSNRPIHDARLHAMTFYRTPQSFKDKFERSVNVELKMFNVESWLLHHGERLENRFKLSSYKLMNHLLTTGDVSKHFENFQEAVSNVSADIHLVAVDTDWLFLAEEIWETYVDLCAVRDNVTISEIKSIHGHDAFLIEYDQLQSILKPIFEKESYEHHDKHHLIWNR